MRFGNKLGAPTVASRMKLCPTCRREYADETMNFCLDDGNALVYGAEDEPATNLLPRALESGSVPTEILTRAVPENGEKSIAVLPFTNIGGDVENEYFCDGL